MRTPKEVKKETATMADAVRQTQPKEAKHVLFETMPIPKAVGILAVPMVISQLIATVYNLADAYFIGQLNDPMLLGAITLVYPVQVILMALGTLFGSGAGTVISRFLGSKDYGKVKQTSAFAVYGSLAVALVFSVSILAFQKPFLSLIGTTEALCKPVSEYIFWVVILGSIPSVFNSVTANLIRAEGASKEAGFGLSGGGLLNMVLDPFFIHSYGLGLQLRGAAIATFISNCATSVYFILYLVRSQQKREVSYNPRYFTLQKSIASSVVTTGVPYALVTLFAAVYNTMLNRLIVGFDEVAVAAIGICKKVDGIPAYVLMGISQGVVPLIAYNYGANNRKRMQSALRFTTVVIVTVAVAFVILFQFFPDKIAALFIQDSKTVSYATTFIRIHCVYVLFSGFSEFMVGVFQALKKNTYATILSITPKGILGIPVMLALSLLIPFYGPIICEPIMGVVAVICAAVMYQRVKKEVILQ